MRNDAFATLELCRKYELGAELQDFKNPKFNYCQCNYKTETDTIKNKSLHGPFGDLAFGSVEPLIREVTLKRIISAYEQAEKYGFTDIIIHHGYVPNTSPPDKWLKRSCEFWKANMECFQKQVRICIENMLDWDCGLLMELIDAIDHDQVKICLDLGHANCFSKEDVLVWIKKLNHRIGYVHMHNNHGVYDEHNALMNGNIRYEKVFEYLQCYASDAILAIETFSDSLELSILYMKELGILNEPKRLGEKRYGCSN
jgi:Sugar phosphate isomerases/epimerases